MLIAVTRRVGATLLLAALAAVTAGCAPPTAEVGACTNQDPDLTVQVVGIEIVDCDSDEATFRIVEEVEDGAECEDGELTVDDQTFCVEPL
jgi:hypothetical protein